MAVPTTRQEFAEYCLRKLGKPVIEINVDDDQVDDRIDEALRYFWDYHFDGSEKVFYKYLVQKNDFPTTVKQISVNAGGTGYQTNDAIVFTTAKGDVGNGAVAVVSSVDDNGGVLTVDVLNGGYAYNFDPVAEVSSNTGSGAILTVGRGGYIPLPDNIIGAVNIFDAGAAIGTNNLFNIRYQIALNDLYTLTSVSMIPYYMALSHIQFLEQMLVGKQPLRYNRHNNKLYIDMDWNRIGPGNFIIVEAYQIVDPNVYTKAWGDRWLARYTESLIKQQWGQNLKKFEGMKLPGGLSFNGQKIYDEATDEREKLEQEMIYTYSLPATDMIG